jgi:hypothetical protein
MAENLREVTEMVSRNADRMSHGDLVATLKMIASLSSTLKTEVDDMNHINALHEFYLARSEWAEGLNVEVD